MSRDTATAWAPGRLDVMGGVADYSGSLLLQLALPQGTTVRLTRTSDDVLRLRSTYPGEAHGQTATAQAEVAAEATAVREAPKWTRYVLGGVLLCAERFGYPLGGLDVDVDSDVPVGAGLSSSAALEVATLRALTELYDLRWADSLELPRLAQRVEHDVVGAPCGLMDQLAVHLGTPSALLPIRCQPASVGAPIPLPPGLRFEARDSGATHDVGAAAYARARAAAFMGRRILEQAGVETGGYLANVDPDRFRREFRGLLPEAMTGADFLSRHAPHLDPQTTVEPGVAYPVRAATAHPIEEHARAMAFAEALRRANANGGRLPRHEKSELGALMYESHAGYSAIGLGHEATDRIVEGVATAPTRVGQFGARVTGGGCGGAVCIMNW